MTPLRVVDAHQHFWRLDMPGHRWPDASLPAIHRDFLPEDLRYEARGIDLAATVLVQSQPNDADTDWLCAMAIREPMIAAVVGWVDLERQDAPARIAALAALPKMRGLRPMLQAIEDDDWILKASVEPGIVAMVARGLSFDALVQPRHLRALYRFASRWPDLPIVIDHGAKPHVARGEMAPWRDDIAALGTLDNVFCKLSGLRTEQRPGASSAELLPYAMHLIETFGDRLMWGSDWPVLRNSGDAYRTWLDTARALVDGDRDREEALFERCASRFYRFDQRIHGVSAL